MKKTEKKITPPIIRRGVVCLELVHKVSESFRIGLVSLLILFLALLAKVHSISYGRINLHFSIAIFSYAYWHISSSPFFLRCLDRINLSIYIISWVLKTNVYAHILGISCLKTLKKTCQVRFFDFVPRLKKFSHAFCSEIVNLNPENYLYQTISL